MANPKILIEVATIGLDKVAANLKKAKDAAAGLVQETVKLGGGSAVGRFKTQASAIDHFKRSLEKLRIEAKRLGVGGEIGTAAAAFARFGARLDKAKLSSQELATQSMRLQGIFDRSAVSVNRTADRLGRLGNKQAQVSARTKQLANDTTNLKNRMRDLGSAAIFAVGPLSGIGARLMAFTAIMNRSNIQLAIFLAGMAGVVVGMVAFVRAAERAELELAKIEGVLIATGKAAFIAAKDIRAISEDIAAITPGGSVAELNKAAAALLTFGGVGKRELKRLLTLSSDLAAVGFQSLERAALTLGAAMEKPSSVIERLNRIVPIFKGRIGDTIRALEKQGRVVEAGEKLLEALENRVGGVAEKMNIGLTAAVGSLSQNFRTLAEDLGNSTGALSVTTGAVQALADVLGFLGDQMRAVTIVLIGLGSALTGLGVIGITKFLKRAIGGWTKFIVLLGFATVAMSAATAESNRLARINKIVSRSTSGLSSDVDDLTEALVSNAAGSREAAEAARSALLSRIRAQIEGLRVTRETIELMREEMGVFGGMAIVINDTVAAFAEIFGGSKFVGFSAFSQGIDNLEAGEIILRVLIDSAKRLGTALGKASDATEELGGKLDKQLNKAISSVKALENQYFKAFRLARASTEEAVRTIEATAKAASILDALGDSQIKSLAKEFGVVGDTVDALRTGLEDLIVTTITMGKRWEDEGSTLRDFKDDLASATLELERLTLPEHERAIRDQLDAFRALAAIGRITAEEFAKLEQTLRKLQFKEFMQGLETPIETVERKLREIDRMRVFARANESGQQLQNTLIRLDFATQAVWDGFKEGVDILGFLETAVTDFGEGVAEAFINAENAMDALRETAIAVIKDILREMLKLTFINPLKNLLFNSGLDTISSVLGSVVPSLGIGGGAPAIAPSIPAVSRRIAIAEHGATFKVGGSGGTDSQKVEFMATPGEVVAVGKRFERTDGGESGGGQNVTVNMNLHDVRDADSFRRSRSRLIAVASRVGGTIAARNANR